MKVAFFTTDLGLTGVPKYVELLALSLPKVGDAQVEVICLQPPLDRLNTLTSQGIPVHVLFPGGLGSSRGEFSRRLRGLLAVLEPDCAHTNLWTYNLNTSWVLYSSGIPEISTWHYFMNQTHFLQRKYLKNTIKELITVHFQQLLGAHFIAIGDHIRRPGVLEKNITTIFTGIPVQDKKKAKEKFPLILFEAARINPAKGQEDLLRAIVRLDKRENYEVWFAGDGPQRLSLEKLAQELSLENIRFLGWRHDVNELLHLADIAVLPSHAGEGLPIFVIESMMSGLPVIGYNIPPLKALVTGACGILVETGDVAALSQALERLLADSDLRASMGKAAHRRAVEHFSDIAFARNVLAVYRKALQRKAYC
jgi:glycosyltransferase involved in cell wall biosynthesis